MDRAEFQTQEVWLLTTTGQTAVWQLIYFSIIIIAAANFTTLFSLTRFPCCIGTIDTTTLSKVQPILTSLHVRCGEIVYHITHSNNN